MKDLNYTAVEIRNLEKEFRENSQGKVALYLMEKINFALFHSFFCRLG